MNQEFEKDADLERLADIVGHTRVIAGEIGNQTVRSEAKIGLLDAQVEKGTGKLIASGKRKCRGFAQGKTRLYWYICCRCSGSDLYLAINSIMNKQ